jgi:hypothetical protein
MSAAEDGADFDWVISAIWERQCRSESDDAVSDAGASGPVHACHPLAQSDSRLDGISRSHAGQASAHRSRNRRLNPWIATEHEGLGITTALATAELLASACTGAAPAIAPEPYLPARFDNSSHQETILHQETT